MGKTYYQSVEERITEAVTAVINDPINEEKLYELLMCGHVAYKGGLGLPHHSVHEAIKRGIIPRVTNTEAHEKGIEATRFRMSQFGVHSPSIKSMEAAIKAYFKEVDHAPK